MDTLSEIINSLRQIKNDLKAEVLVSSLREKGIQKESMNLLQVIFGTGAGQRCISNQLAVLRGQHIDVHFLYVLIFIEVGNNHLRAKPNRFVCLYVSAENLALNFHPLLLWPLRLMAHHRSISLHFAGLCFCLLFS